MFIASFTHNLFWSIRRIGCYDRFLALSALSFVKSPGISKPHPGLMSLIWVEGRYVDSIFYIKCEFLWYDFKRST